MRSARRSLSSEFVCIRYRLLMVLLVLLVSLGLLLVFPGCMQAPPLVDDASPGPEKEIESELEHESEPESEPGQEPEVELEPEPEQEPEVELEPEPPQVIFGAELTALIAGSNTNLLWHVHGADEITIIPDVGNVAEYGSTPVSPESTTTYTLTATNQAGTTLETVEISVSPLFISPILRPGITLPAPSVKFFASDMSLLTQGLSATLSWDVSGMASVTIEPGIGVVGPSGTAQVTPSTATTYTLTASNVSGSVSETVTINLARQVVIQPGPGEGMDTHVSSVSFYKDINLADWNILLMGKAENLYRSLLQFNVSCIPSDAIIVSADLSMYQWNTFSSEGYNVSAHEINTPWDLFTVTWNNQPHYAKASESTKLVTPGVTQWISWDLRNLVQGWVEESIINNGVVLKKTNELESTTYIAGFYSSNHTAQPGARPRLDIIYYVP